MSRYLWPILTHPSPMSRSSNPTLHNYVTVYDPHSVIISPTQTSNHQII